MLFTLPALRTHALLVLGTTARVAMIFDPIALVTDLAPP